MSNISYQVCGDVSKLIQYSGPAINPVFVKLIMVSFNPVVTLEAAVCQIYIKYPGIHT